MVENFMDYSADDCSNLFTEGQKTRMLSFLNTDRLGLLSSDGCSFATVGMATNQSFNNSVLLYPNPSNGKFTISSDKRMRIEKIIVFDNLGQNILDLHVNNLAGAPIEIDISSFISGIYVARIYSSEGISAVKLILNQ